MIFAQHGRGLPAIMPTLLPEGILSAAGGDAQAVNSSWETASVLSNWRFFTRAFTFLIFTST
jgi:hypothetical protein